jgi:hypothetical protein
MKTIDKYMSECNEVSDVRDDPHRIHIQWLLPENELDRAVLCMLICNALEFDPEDLKDCAPDQSGFWHFIDGAEYVVCVEEGFASVDVFRVVHDTTDEPYIILESLYDDDDDDEDQAYEEALSKRLNDDFRTSSLLQQQISLDQSMRVMSAQGYFNLRDYKQWEKKVAAVCTKNEMHLMELVEKAGISRWYAFVHFEIKPAQTYQIIMQNDENGIDEFVRRLQAEKYG